MESTGAKVSSTAFSREHAAEIASWVRGEAEAKSWAGSATTFPISHDHFRLWHEELGVHPLVSNRDGELVAYGELWVDTEEQEIELARIIVHPEHRGTGVGHSFVELLVGHAASFGLKGIFIRVLPDNLAAIRCYQAAGFVSVAAEVQRAFNQGQPHAYLWLKHGAST